MDHLNSWHLLPEESGYGDWLYGSRTGLRQAKLHGSLWVPGPVILRRQDTVRTSLNMLLKTSLDIEPPGEQRTGFGIFLGDAAVTVIA